MTFLSNLKPSRLVRNLCLTALVGSLFASCKPADNPPPPQAGISGVLMTFRISGSLLGMPLDSIYSAYAGFSTTPGGNIPAFVDSIKVNGMDMEIDGDSVGYLDSDFMGSLNFSSGVQWDVQGANGIPSFSYQYSGAYPAFTATLPDTIDRSAGFSLVLNGSTAPNTDTVRAELLSLGTDSLGKSAAVSTGGIHFSAAELAGVTPAGEAMIILTLTAGTTQPLGGKNFYFTKVRQYVKPVYFR